MRSTASPPGRCARLTSEPEGFHRAGTAGSVDDPSLSFSLGPGRVAWWPDIVSALGQSGLGSLDIVIGPTGVPARTIMKRYPPNWFEQVAAAAFLEGPISPNQSIRFTIDAGSAIIYGSTTDNSTNDPAIQLVNATYVPG